MNSNPNATPGAVTSPPRAVRATQTPTPIEPRVPGGPPPPEPPVVPPDDPHLPDVNREPNIDPPPDPAPVGWPSEPPPGLVPEPMRLDAHAGAAR